MMNTVLRTAVVAIASSLLVGQSVYSAETYVIDGAHTSIIFGVSHFGYSYTYGRFNKVSGGYVLDRENPAASQFQLTISAASLDTNNPKRDQHLKSPDFFNVKQFPVISFQSTTIAIEQSKKGPIYNVTGDLTIHGVTRQVTLPLQKLGEGNGPGGKFRTGFHCETSLNRSEFGMTHMIPKVGNEIALTISFEGIRQNALAAAP
ncbi:MAG: YceI family protein [Planctomycetes bacterium]|nr:YceI family protein [Planctomycetota bacterium]